MSQRFIHTLVSLPLTAVDQCHNSSADSIDLIYLKPVLFFKYLFVVLVAGTSQHAQDPEQFFLLMWHNECTIDRKFVSKIFFEVSYTHHSCI